MVETRKRLCYFVAGLSMSFVSFCLICVSLATNYWVESEPRKNATLHGPDKGKGKIHFGLFRGTKVFDSGFGIKDREAGVSILDYIRKENLFPFAFWVMIIILAILVVVLNISSTALCLLNLLTKPFRTSQGPIGICFVNVASLLLTIILIALYLAVFAGWLSRNVLTRVERDKSWISPRDATFLRWSFWLLPAAAAAQFLALVAAAAAAAAGDGDGGAEDLKNCCRRRCCCCCCGGGGVGGGGKKDDNAEVNMHDVMIY